MLDTLRDIAGSLDGWLRFFAALLSGAWFAVACGIVIGTNTMQVKSLIAPSVRTKACYRIAAGSLQVLGVVIGLSAFIASLGYLAGSVAWLLEGGGWKPLRTASVVSMCNAFAFYAVMMPYIPERFQFKLD